MDDSSVTMLAVISGHQLRAHLPMAGDEKGQINIGADCEMQTFDVGERGEKGVQRENATGGSAIPSHPPKREPKEEQPLRANAGIRHLEL